MHLGRFRKYGTFEKQTRVYKTGYHLSEDHKAKISRSNKGKVHSRIHNLRVSESLKGKKASLETKIILSNAHKGVKLSEYHRKQISIGKLAKSTFVQTERRTGEYVKWRNAVLKRDNRTCVICNLRSTFIHVDHIKKFSDYPELRTDINNGRTLCYRCHYKVTFNKEIPDSSKWGQRNMRIK